MGIVNESPQWQLFNVLFNPHRAHIFCLGQIFSFRHPPIVSGMTRGLLLYPVVYTFDNQPLQLM